MSWAREETVDDPVRQADALTKVAPPREERRMEATASATAEDVRGFRIDVSDEPNCRWV